MRLLIIGGTVFLGRHIVDAARERGHTVTLFNRGKSNPRLFPDVEQIVGDRERELERLSGRVWDVVVDTCGYVPRIVGASARMLEAACELYVFVSSVSVYRDFSRYGITEGSPLAQLDDPAVEEVTGETYGALKALCEAEVTRAVGERALIVRPGLIVGPCDPSDRFTYWPVRASKGGDAIAPGSRERRVQFIDGRDLGQWIVEMCERRACGIYNAVGPEGEFTFGELLDLCCEAVPNPARFHWLPERFLLDQGVAPWTELPLWIPDDDESRGMDAVSGSRAFEAGLKCRAVQDTVRDTLEWHSTLPPDRPQRAGITLEREQAVLGAWLQHGLHEDAVK